MKEIKERRGSPRREKSIPVFFSHDREDSTPLESKTINLGANGLYCTVEKQIELYTKVFCTLVHPADERDEKVIIEGVVVRCEEGDSVSRYNVAVFFSNVSDNDRKKIESWIS